MTPGLPIKPSKTHGQENFPVASVLIAPKHRATILAYYRFARGADDVADSPLLAPDAKLAGLDLFEATLTGQCDTIEAALPLRAALALRKLSPRHALDLLRAFRMDAVKHRYANWSELMDYCAYSAAPVGRFVLDVHGESESTWPASDALCTALQIINHLQDCGADYRNLDRVYVPQDAFAAHGVRPDALGAAKSSPGRASALPMGCGPSSGRNGSRRRRSVAHERRGTGRAASRCVPLCARQFVQCGHAYSAAPAPRGDV
jgi:squalene synthase HpnC